MVEIEYEQNQQAAESDEIGYLVFLHVFNDIGATRRTEADGSADDRAGKLEA